MLRRVLLLCGPFLALAGSVQGQVGFDESTALPAVGPFGPTVEVVTQKGVVSRESAATVVAQEIFTRVQIFASLRAGYDSNSRTEQTAQGSWFTSQHVSLSYHLPSRTTQLGIVAGLGASTYTDRTTVNVFFDLSLSRHITRRLGFNASVSAIYTSEPNLNANVGTNSFAGNYFNLNGNLSASYAVTPLLSTVSSFGFVVVRYENAVTAAFTDREQYTLGEQLRFSLSKTTVLTGSYSLLFVDYVDAPFDSIRQFALAGVEYRFSSHLSGQFSAGASYRSYSEGRGQTNPNFNGSLDYAYGKNSLAWTTSYGVEQPSERGIATQTTFRTGLTATHSFTGRISSSLGVSYSHNENQQGASLAAIGPVFSEDVIGISLNARYQYNSRLGFDLGFLHSEISSGQAFQEYSRDRYSAGVSYSF